MSTPQQPGQHPAPTSTEALAASIALAVERQLTDYMASVSRQIADLRTALDATRVELRAELHGEWRSALDTMHRELEEHARQTPEPAEPVAPAPAPFDPSVIEASLDALRAEFHVELVDRINSLQSRLTEDTGAKLAALEVAIGRTGSGFDEAVAAVSRRLHELDDATHSLLGRIDQLDARVGETDNSGLDQLKEQLSSALGEVMLVRIEIDRAVASTEDKIGKATLRMAEIEALLSDEMDVSSAVQLERLDEIERAIAELDPNHLVPTGEPTVLPTLPTLPRTGN